MAKTVIPLAQARGPLAIPMARSAHGPLADTRARALRDLRISVTDRCNFRCTYCMPRDVFGDDYEFLPHAEVLTFEEIVRMATIFHGLGTEKIRLTGGEPYPFLATLSYNEAARWMDSNERVERALAWPALTEWMGAWVEQNYKPEPKRRQRPKSFDGKEGRFRKEGTS